MLPPQRNITFEKDLRETVTWPPSATDYAGNPMARELNQAGIYLGTAFQYFLAFVLILATVFIVWFFATISHDANRQFLRFYFGAGYLILVASILGKIFALQHQKHRRRRMETQAGSFPMDFAALDPGILQNAKFHLERGEPIESACGFANPHYVSWSDHHRHAYHVWVLSQVQGAPAAGASAGIPPAATSEVPVEQFQTPVIAPEPSPPPAKPWLTAKQITIIAIVFILSLAGFTTLFFAARLR